MLSMTAPPFSATRTITVLVLFVLVMAVLVMIVELEHRHAMKKETHRRALEILQRKAELRRQKEQEAADDHMLDQIEEYRNDFDGYRKSS